MGRLEDCKPGDGVSPVQPPESSDCPGETDVTPVATAEALPSFLTLLIIYQRNQTIVYFTTHYNNNNYNSTIIKSL